MSAYVYEYEAPLPFPAKPADTFKALVEENALKTWFAEHVEVDGKEGGAYRFWGRYSLDTATQKLATQSVTRFEPGEALGFSWRLLGRDSEVTWTLVPEGDDATKVTVRHEFSSLPDGVRVKEMIDDLWRLHTGNLCFYLHGNDKIFRPDFDDPSPEVRHAIMIDAPPAKVFAALIEPEQIKKWFPAPAPVVEPRVGGKYGFGFSFERDGQKIEPPPMEILEFVENERLAITWPDWRGDKSVPDQKITWVLEDLGGKTRLTLTHSGFVRAVDVSEYPFGWVEFIGKIKEVAEAL